jgi:hypothetical protein
VGDAWKKVYKLRLPNSDIVGDDRKLMSAKKGRGAPLKGHELITLAQKLARDAERHAILSASLASQADRLMVAGLQLLEPPRSATPKETRLSR